MQRYFQLEVVIDSSGILAVPLLFLSIFDPQEEPPSDGGEQGQKGCKWGGFCRGKHERLNDLSLTVKRVP